MQTLTGEVQSVGKGYLVLLAGEMEHRIDTATRFNPGDMVEVSYAPTIRKVGADNTNADWIDVYAADGVALSLKLFKKGRIKKETAVALMEEAKTHGGFRDEKVKSRCERWSK